MGTRVRRWPCQVGQGGAGLMLCNQHGRHLARTGRQGQPRQVLGGAWACLSCGVAHALGCTEQSRISAV
jgi:hypothetical protein